jgi:hypothetical protein
LAVADEELDLGRVWETNRHEHIVHITNLLDRPVTIARFATTCDCLGITPAAERSTVPALSASTVGLLGSPPGQGPFLAASVLFPARTAVSLASAREQAVRSPVVARLPRQGRARAGRRAIPGGFYCTLLNGWAGSWHGRLAVEGSNRSNPAV